ncbi:2,4-dienoyl-CoA reductase [Boletus edulis BED1]|uniref:2,4-dienoyl-CoA reductase [(3E)-enoyl-CoA-producing] n=1 Tax=Boletus edulis BED1 TaxID=1328754 RepID=A0AAD4G972_BOLED|nr:2,4-dienoyl-CoA reductase [Boletus edulis BED1]
MSSRLVVAPVTSSTDVFRQDVFKGKVVFCTGGGSGICKSMTEAMMRHGANAAIAGRNLEKLTQSAHELSRITGQKCIPTQADVRQPQQLKDAVAKTMATFGRIDFVICGAAGNFLASIDGMSENAFKTVIEIDTIGTFNTVKATLPHVRASHGSYIHVSATLHYKGTPYQVHVSAAKAGVDALSAVLAVEEGPRGVRSNVIAPGPIGNTEGLSRLSNQSSDSRNGPPLGRVGHLNDVANATVFLFSDAASYITGQVLPVDGGIEHLRTTQLPYPQSMLDPDSVKHMIKSRM